MSYRLDSIRDYFHRLGLEAEVADIYFSLYTLGPQTISALARSTSVERTRIYRLLDTLQKNALVEIEERHKSKLLKAVPLSNLHILFSNKEQELLQLQKELPRVEQILEQNVAASSGTKVQFYHGSDGAKQMLWNETNAKSEVVAILHDNIQIMSAEKFFERWVARANERNLHFRGVVSDNFIQSQQIWYETHVNERLKNWSERYIKSDLYEINHSTTVYDNVVTYSSWKDDEIYGIEIYNQEIADGQRKFFEMLWEQAT